MTEFDDIQRARLYADDELPEAERADFEARLAEQPALRARVEFERRLRRELVAAMEPVQAPEGLAGRVRVALAAEGMDGADGADGGDGGVGGGIRRLFRGPTRANGLAVAASLAIVLTAVLIGILGRPIDHWGGAEDSVGDLVAAAAEYVSGEHDRCVSDESVRQSHCKAKSRAAAARTLAAHLGTPVTVFDLGSMGYEFCGAGESDVPGGEPSGHLIYFRPPSEDAAPGFVSIFVVPDVGQFDGGADALDEGDWYESNGGPRCSHVVLRSSDGRLVYFLVCCQEGEIDRLAGLIGGRLE